jgi:hypothetical protein
MSFSPQKALIIDINTLQYYQLSRGLVSDEVKIKPHVEVLGWLHVFCGCKAGWT